LQDSGGTIERELAMKVKLRSDEDMRLTMPSMRGSQASRRARACDAALGRLQPGASA
jgi:hypothetical protein